QFSESTLIDNIIAATFDIQEPTQPLLVGGVSVLPTGEDAQEDIAMHFRRYVLTLKFLLGQPFSPEESELFLYGRFLPTSMDSIRLYPTKEWEKQGDEFIQRKRLYVANGNGGIVRLNLDEQNGLQFLSRVLGYCQK
ncbi:MAG: hypothetical protein V3R93_01990, partial [Candidatus Hydrothermarchaeaceae archaeon]